MIQSTYRQTGLRSPIAWLPVQYLGIRCRHAWAQHNDKDNNNLLIAWPNRDKREKV